MKLGVVMDPIAAINSRHDATLSLLWEAEARGWPIYYFEPNDLYIVNGKAFGRARLLNVFRDNEHWFALHEPFEVALSELDVMLMRKDPPVNDEFIYLTYILELAEKEGVLIVNKPQTLRDANEKLITAEFADCCVPTVVTSRIDLLRSFWQKEQDIVCKPLHVMGGTSVFRIQPQDQNATVIFETLTEKETRHVMAQRYIPAILQEGDKRIILINGEPFPMALARIPQKGEWRGNIVAGAKPVAQPLSERDYWICSQVGPYLKQKGVYFAGIDVIGDYLTEINVTSPSCIRELDEQCNSNISAQLFDCLKTLIN
ncbi:MAG TPA: glutathione synthase [Gammaproteobacteria bacterium]|nr:glutathione synthase [Gammaproteobacteria bacterium]